MVVSEPAGDAKRMSAHREGGRAGEKGGITIRIRITIRKRIKSKSKSKSKMGGD